MKNFSRILFFFLLLLSGYLWSNQRSDFDLESISRVNLCKKECLGKKVILVGGLRDVPRLILTNDGHEIPVYSIKNKLDLLDKGFFNKGATIKIYGVYRYSQMNQEFYIEECFIEFE